MTEPALTKSLRAHYECYYEGGDSAEWRRLSAVRKVDNVLALCQSLPHATVLEIGAGEGSILERLSERRFGDELYALEISPSGVDSIKKKSIPRLVACDLFDGYRVPHADDSFDIAILSHVVEHVEHPRQLLYEAARVARYVFIEVPLEDTLRLPNDYVPDRVGHINFYSPKTFRRLVQSCGLRVLAQLTGNPPKEAYSHEKGRSGLVNYYIKETLLRVFPALATKLFTYHGALVCEKPPRDEVDSLT